jgi:hypothetical protein
MRRNLSLLRRNGATRLSGRVLLLAATLMACAPAAASLAARAVIGGSETYASLIICFASGKPLPDAQPGRPGNARHRGIDCVLCETLCSGGGPLAARPDVVDAAPIQTVNLPWMVADRAASMTRWPRSSNQARAPPA